jgi:protein SCO1/2
MNQPARKVEWLVWGGLAIVVITVLLAFLVSVLRFRSVKAPPLPVLAEVADFSLTNQLGQPFSLASLKGQVWVADIIFTRCAGPCPRMTRQMKELQDALPNGASNRLVTLTTDPKFDTPEVMRRYAERFGADPERWVFLTGSPKEIAKLATESLKLTAIEKTPAEQQSPADLFIHSTIFVVVDKKGRLRGIYETTGEDIDPQKVKAQILSAVKRLDRES